MTSEQQTHQTRRAALLALGVGGAALLATTSAPQSALAKTATRQAGDFCPPSSTDGFVLYKPDGRATPSIRAGVIQPEFYSFELPPTWTEGTILNILSGTLRCPCPLYI